MKSVYFLLATFLCLLIFITHGNSAPGPLQDDQSPDRGTGLDGDNELQESNLPTSKPKTTIKNNTTMTSGGTLGSLSDPDTMKRMLYVLLGFTTLVVAFFAFKTIRQRTRRKTKKYGVLATPASDVELTPLDQEDDDEDMTVFDANSK